MMRYLRKRFCEWLELDAEGITESQARKMILLSVIAMSVVIGAEIIITHY